MLENLRTRLYNDNTAIRFDTSGGSLGTTSQTWSVLTYGAHTIYAHDSFPSPSNLETYGYLYNWYAAKGIATAGSTTYKNICPTGWHVPTDSDWSKIVKFIDSGADTTSTSSTQSTSAGNKLKKYDALWRINTGTNDFLFSAIPGGYRDDDGTFWYVRDNAVFWSATQNDNFSSFAWGRFLEASNGDMSRYSTLWKLRGHSVRCLRD
jgi:uncharacterized protein (TIGR02145 family)